MSNKIFITGPSNIDKLGIAKLLIEKDDDLSISERFTNDKEYMDSENDEYIYYLSTQDIDLTYKNNFILFVNTNNYISTGITLDNFYNDDIFVMSLCEFNNISDLIFKSENYDIIVIWIDSDYGKKSITQNDIDETNFLIERLEASPIKYMYFHNEDNEKIADTILEYINGDEVKKCELLDENN